MNNCNEEEWAWSQIIGPRESLALYKSFNTLCAQYCSEVEVRHEKMSEKEIKAKIRLQLHPVK